MASFGDVIALVSALQGRGDDAVTADGLPGMLAEAPDDVAVSVLTEVSEIIRHAEQLRSVAAAVIQVRSSREQGHAGLAQLQGHASATSLVRDVTGSTRAEAARLVRVGTSLLEASGAVNAEGESDGVGAPSDAAEADAVPVVPRSPVWHASLARAVQQGALTLTQQDAIRRGLGEPPTAADALAHGCSDCHDGEQTRRDEDDADVLTCICTCTAEQLAEQDAAWREAWQAAAEQLIVEATQRTVEELTSAARGIRDMLDPAGARKRFLARFERRSFRTWSDRDGVKHGSFVFDDDGFAMVTTVADAALRPRRGGPRFVDSEQKSTAAQLAADPRTNDQLAYDLFIDLIRAGMHADAATVFGTRRPGVRVITVQRTAPDGSVELGVGHTEDRLVTLPESTVEQHVCEAGMVPVTVDRHGDPLRVGRAQRLFTSVQRVALAVRDGGCRWPDCDRPASYCEAHHIDPWNDGGRTDVDRGILLCRFHHMQLHHGAWRIRRHARGDFTLHDPGGKTTTLRPRAVLRYAWADDRPPPRFRTPVRAEGATSDAVAAAGIRPPRASAARRAGTPARRYDRAPHPGVRPG